MADQACDQQPEKKALSSIELSPLQAPHICPNPTLWASSLTGCAQNRRPLCSRIWLHGLDGQSGLNKALRLACWNADGVRGRKQELDHFLGQHGTDICLLTVTHLRSDEVFRLANYVCHRNNRLTEGGGTAILVRRGIPT
jgi:hypothetical protein